MGATIWHGPHHVAQKSTSTSPFACSISSANESSLTWTVGVFVVPGVLVASMWLFSLISHWYFREESVSDRPRIAHVGIAVSDLDDALAFYREVLGLEPHAPEVVDGARILTLPFGDSAVELLAPLQA